MAKKCKTKNIRCYNRSCCQTVQFFEDLISYQISITLNNKVQNMRTYATVVWQFWLSHVYQYAQVWLYQILFVFAFYFVSYFICNIAQHLLFFLFYTLRIFSLHDAFDYKFCLDFLLFVFFWPCCHASHRTSTSFPVPVKVTDENFMTYDNTFLTTAGQQ